jgi:cysteine desulfuration protein SufE
MVLYSPKPKEKQMTIDEEQDWIISEFSGLDDWLEKYEYLSMLGRNHAGIDPNMKTDHCALRGCQSQVWICAKMSSGKLSFMMDSDSLIIRGILALLLRVIDNRSPDEIMNADFYFLKQIGLNTNLSPSRANGVASIVKTIRQWGQRYLK